jgi:Mannosyl-glycoprotein endo-beta-N-acetylglucosaminidase
MSAERAFWDQCFAIARKCGARFPELVAAQCCLESGFGKHFSGANNVLGLKGDGTTVSTKEFYDGQWVTIKAGFLDFPSIAACIEYLITRWYKDYRHFKGINNAPNRYAAARMLYQQKYATDPNYPTKLSKLMKQYAPESTTVTMIGPKKRPQDFGFKQGDSHLIVNDASETMKAFSFEGKLLWEIPCLARGQYSDFEWKLQKSDTPPGLYRLGQLYNDYALHGDKAPYDRTLMAYGWAFYDMIELEGQEKGTGRAGIGLHGGGSALGWPGAWAPKQALVATHGCCRIFNQDLINKVLPLYRKGTVFVSVFQESQ